MLVVVAVMPVMMSVMMVMRETVSGARRSNERWSTRCASASCRVARRDVIVIVVVPAETAAAIFVGECIVASGFE